MKISKELALSILDNDLDPQADGFEMVEEGEWEDDGKWQHRTTIVKRLASGKFYELSDSRSGSYYSDYYYQSEDWEAEVELSEVEPYEKTVRCWRGINQTTMEAE